MQIAPGSGHDLNKTHTLARFCDLSMNTDQPVLYQLTRYCQTISALEVELRLLLLTVVFSNRRLLYLGNTAPLSALDTMAAYLARYPLLIFGSNSGSVASLFLISSSDSLTLSLLSGMSMSMISPS